METIKMSCVDISDALHNYLEKKNLEAAINAIVTPHFEAVECWQNIEYMRFDGTRTTVSPSFVALYFPLQKRIEVREYHVSGDVQTTEADELLRAAITGAVVDSLILGDLL